MTSVVLFSPFDKGNSVTERLSNMFQDTQQISGTEGIGTQGMRLQNTQY